MSYQKHWSSGPDGLRPAKEDLHTTEEQTQKVMMTPSLLPSGLLGEVSTGPREQMAAAARFRLEGRGSALQVRLEGELCQLWEVGRSEEEMGEEVEAFRRFVAGEL